MQAAQRQNNVNIHPHQFAALEREHQLLKDTRTCASCVVRMREVTFLPCGHFLMCKTCAEPIYECPVCRKEILATAQTYLC